MGTYRAAAGYVSGMITACCIIPVTNMLGGTQSAWVKFGAVFAAVTLLCLLLCYKTSKESINGEESGKDYNEESVDFKEAIGKLFQNKYWVMVLVLNFIVNVSYNYSCSNVYYYFKV